MPDKIIRWLRPENRKPFYVTITLIVFCGMCLLVLGTEKIDKSLPIDEQLRLSQENDSRMKVAGFGGAIITGIYLIIRSEQNTSYSHQTTHATLGVVNALTSNAQLAVATADDAASKAKAAVDNFESFAKQFIGLESDIKSALNGGLRERLDQVFKLAQQAYATPTTPGQQFPGTMKDLEEIMDHRCGSIATNAARIAVKDNMAELRRVGLIPVVDT